MVGIAGQASATTSAPADVGAHINGASITFTTLDDDKDGDTFLSVVVKDRNNRVAARTSGFFGLFPDQTAITLPPMTIRPAATWDDIENGGTVTVSIAPNGNDTWKFAYELDLTYDDGDEGFHVNPGTSLSESHRTLTDPLT